MCVMDVCECVVTNVLDVSQNINPVMLYDLPMYLSHIHRLG